VSFRCHRRLAAFTPSLTAVEPAGLDPIADALLLGCTVDGGFDAVLRQRPQDLVLLLDAAVGTQDRLVGRLLVQVAPLPQAQPRRSHATTNPLVVGVLEEL